MNLQEMMNVGLRSRTFKHSGPKWIGVNTTVPERSESYPTGSKFLNSSREWLIRLYQEHEVALRHSYFQIGANALCKANKYAHALQIRRMRGQVKKCAPIWNEWYGISNARLSQSLILQVKFADKLSLAHRVWSKSKMKRTSFTVCMLQ